MNSRKKIIFYIFLLVSCESFSQNNRDSCSSLDSIRAYIIEAKDHTVRKAGEDTIKMGVWFNWLANGALLKKGIHLSLNDTTYKVRSFCLVYESDYDNQWTIVETCSNLNENFVLPNIANQYLKNIERTPILTVELIIVEKNGGCYKIPPVIYYVLK